jgi:hypothetical protein
MGCGIRLRLPIAKLAMTNNYVLWSPLPLTSRRRKVLLFTFSLFYGYTLQALPALQFLDRENYINYASHPLIVLAKYVAAGPLTVLANEPIWLLLNAALAAIFGPEEVVRIIIVSGATMFCYTFIKIDSRNVLWLILFMLTPQLLKNYITHLRQGLAMAVFFIGYFSLKPFSKWGLMFAAPFIHASFFFVLPIIMVPTVINRMRFGVDIRLISLASLAIFVSLSIGIIAAAVGARQFENYNFQMSEISGLGFVFWTGIGSLFLLQGKSFLQNHQEAMGILLFYLIAYFFLDFSVRIFESGMPLVLIAGLALSNWRRLVFLLAYLVYGLLQLGLRFTSSTPF